MRARLDQLPDNHHVHLQPDRLPAEAFLSRLSPSGNRPNSGAGAYLDDDHVLVGVFTAPYDNDMTEVHHVLSTRSLRWVATVDYGQDGAIRGDCDRAWPRRPLAHLRLAGTRRGPIGARHIRTEPEAALFDVPGSR